MIGLQCAQMREVTADVDFSIQLDDGIAIGIEPLADSIEHGLPCCAIPLGYVIERGGEASQGDHAAAAGEKLIHLAIEIISSHGSPSGAIPARQIAAHGALMDAIEAAADIKMYTHDCQRVDGRAEITFWIGNVRRCGRPRAAVPASHTRRGDASRRCEGSAKVEITAQLSKAGSSAV